MARLFVATWPPPAVVEALRSIERPEQPDLRFTTEDQWHVTLRFLGNVADDDVAAVAAALEAVGSCAAVEAVRAAGAAAARTDRGRARRRRSRAGGRRRARPSVGSASSGDRRFHGHLTIARMRRPGSAGACAAGVGGPRASRVGGGRCARRDPVQSHLGAAARPATRRSRRVRLGRGRFGGGDLSPDARPGRSGGMERPGRAGGSVAGRSGGAGGSRRLDGSVGSSVSRSVASERSVSSVRSRSQRRRPASQASASSWCGSAVTRSTQPRSARES